MRAVARIEGRLSKVEEGKLRGQRIATLEGDDGATVKFDVIEGLVDFVEGEKLALEILDDKPESLEEYAFCGHGYIAKPEEEAGKTIFSVWGILFIFDKKLGLQDGKKYYLCIRRLG